MRRYCVEYVTHYAELNVQSSTVYLYVYAYSPEQVKDMLKEYHIVAIDQTD